jgi:hypothetical protein
MNIEKKLQDLAKWDLERHRNNYPAGALDKDSCFYNAQIGNCGVECPCYLLGNCPVEAEVKDSDPV